MKNTFIVISLLLFAVALRVQNYAVYPQRGATSDEYAFAFQGISLLTGGVPIAWSAIPLYKDRTNLTIDGLYFPIVKPYLDHPPLFGLVVGGWAVLAGERTFASVRLATIRLVPVALSLISSIFLYLLAKQVYGDKIARWSLAIFSAATLFVVNSRVVVAESLVTPLWLVALLMTTRVSKKSSTKTLLVIGFLCAASILAKILGVVVWLSVVAILWYRKETFKQLMIVSGAAAIGFLALYLYGRVYGETLFWAVQSYQGTARVLGPNTIWMMLGSPSIVNKIYYDGWYFWGLFALGLAAFDVRKNILVVIPAFLYLLLLIVSVNQTDIHGWYFLPLFPFLAVASGRALVDAVENCRYTIFLWAMLIGAQLIDALYAVPFGLTPTVYRWLIGIILSLAILSLRSKRVGYGMAVVCLIGTAIATLQYIHPA